MQKNIFDKLKKISDNHELINTSLTFTTDPVDFINTHGKILHPTRGVIPFNLQPHQKKLIQSYDKNSHNVVLSGRQAGITYTSAAYALHQSFFNAENNILVAADTLRGAGEILSKIRIIYDHLPESYKESNKLILNHRYQLSFANGTNIIAAPIDAETIRGYSLNLVIADNFSCAANHTQDEFLCCVMAALPPNGRVIITSTVAITHTPFERLWLRAVNGENIFVPHRIRWDDVPYRDEDFKQSILNVHGDSRWKQEYECTFID